VSCCFCLEIQSGLLSQSTLHELPSLPPSVCPHAFALSIDRSDRRHTLIMQFHTPRREVGSKRKVNSARTKERSIDRCRIPTSQESKTVGVCMVEGMPHPGPSLDRSCLPACLCWRSRTCSRRIYSAAPGVFNRLLRGVTPRMLEYRNNNYHAINPPSLAPNSVLNAHSCMPAN